MVASATSVHAPASEWSQHGPLTDDENWHSATNPSVVFAANGSVTMCVSRGYVLGPNNYTKANLIMRADSWNGKYHNVTPPGAATHSGEDPDIRQTLQ